MKFIATQRLLDGKNAASEVTFSKSGQLPSLPPFLKHFFKDFKNQHSLIKDTLNINTKPHNMHKKEGLKMQLYFTDTSHSH